MKTPKKTEKKNNLKKSKPTDTKKLNGGTDEPKVKSTFIDDEDGFDDVPLDELDNFESFNEFDDEDDY